MPFQIVRNDITHMHVDAIVNAANDRLLRGGGVCGAIFAAAGVAELEAACARIGHCETGSAVATPAFALPARHIIHAVGPIWRGGAHGEELALRSCYRTSLELAHSLGDTSIAFPLISSGIYGYPKDAAIDVALDEIRSFLADDNHEMDVYLTLFDVEAMRAASGRFGPITALINDLYVEQNPFARRRLEDGISVLNAPLPEAAADMDATAAFEALADGAAPSAPEPWTEPRFGSYATSAPQAAPAPPTTSKPKRRLGSIFGDRRERRRDATATQTTSAPQAAPYAPPAASGSSLEQLLQQVDAGFSATLLTMIDERSLKDSDVYKRANMSRQHFSKIRNNPSYRPKKATVLALAVALELDPADTRLLLERAGFALTHADARDVIVEYFIERGTYDIYEINLALYTYDQPLLG